jgi:hypothetical protein
VRVAVKQFSFLMPLTLTQKRSPLPLWERDRVRGKVNSLPCNWSHYKTVKACVASRRVRVARSFKAGLVKQT